MGKPRPAKRARTISTKNLLGESSADILRRRNQERAAENEARVAVIEEEDKQGKEANERAAAPSKAPEAVVSVSKNAAMELVRGILSSVTGEYKSYELAYFGPKRSPYFTQ